MACTAMNAFFPYFHIVLSLSTAMLKRFQEAIYLFMDVPCFLDYNSFSAHSTHILVSGTIINLSNGIGSSHSLHSPKSGSFIVFKTRSSLVRVCFALLNAASFILLLLMASIRVSRPMALSGAIGRVSCL